MVFSLLALEVASFPVVFYKIVKNKNYIIKTLLVYHEKSWF